jgi:hypothetical protein
LVGPAFLAAVAFFAVAFFATIAFFAAIARTSVQPLLTSGHVVY